MSRSATQCAKLATLQAWSASTAWQRRWHLLPLSAILTLAPSHLTRTRRNMTRRHDVMSSLLKQDVFFFQLYIYIIITYFYMSYTIYLVRSCSGLGVSLYIFSSEILGCSYMLWVCLREGCSPTRVVCRGSTWACGGPRRWNGFEIWLKIYWYDLSDKIWWNIWNHVSWGGWILISALTTGCQEGSGCIGVKKNGATVIESSEKCRTQCKVGGINQYHPDANSLAKFKFWEQRYDYWELLLRYAPFKSV